MCWDFGFPRHCYVVFDCFDHVPCYLIRTRNTFHGCKNWFGMLNALRRHSLLKLLEAYGSTAVMTVLKSALELRKNGLYSRIEGSSSCSTLLFLHRVEEMLSSLMKLRRQVRGSFSLGHLTFYCC